MADDYLISIVARLRDEASSKIKNLQRAVDELKASSAAGDVTSDLRQGLADTADEAERTTRAHRDLNKEHQETGRVARQTESDVRRSADQHERSARAVSSHAASHEDLSGSVGDTGESIEKLSQKLSGAEDAMKRVQAGESALGQSTDKVADSFTRAQKQGDTLVAKMGQLDQAARSHTASNSALTSGYKQVETGLKSVLRQFDAGSSEARRFGDAMDDAGKKAKNIDLARSSSDIGQFVQKVGAATDSIGIKIISLSAALRGARLAGLVGLFQPIVTGLISMAGAFFSVGAGAAQAGATIGGVFISGLGQMIPMLSIAAAALIRLRDVFQAVQAAQAEKQENAYQPFQGLITQLQNTNQLIEAEQSLTNSYYALQDAQVQVKESQIALTQARIDAIRNLQDLVIAEKSAELQLKEANLSEVQAKEALAAAKAGGSQQAIEQAQLQLQGSGISQQQAVLGVPRAQQNLSLAQSYGVAGSPGVLSANEALRQSLLGVKQAYQQIGAAQRQMKITQLTLEEPASHETQQQATLQYLLGQMSAPEKKLYSVLNNLESQLRSPNSPLKKISDYIIQPFTYAFQRLDALLDDKSFLAPITKLAKAMGGGLQSIFGTMFGSRGTSFFKTMATDATQSIPVVVKAITGLMDVFEDIAKAAAPAFKRLSTDWARFWDAMDAKDRSPAGQERLTKFFDQGAKWAEDFGKLAGAVFNLFKALGHDAAPQGMTLVQQMTEAVHDATTWVQSHGPEVTNFFVQSRQGFLVIGALLIQIGTALIQVFSLQSLQAFAQFITQIVLPALKTLVDGIGFIVRQLMILINAFGPAKAIIEGLVAAFAGLLILNRFISMVTKATIVLGGFSEAMKAFRDGDGILNRITSAWDALTGRITKGTKAMQSAKTAQGELATATTGENVVADATSGGVILPAGVSRTAAAETTGVASAEDAGILGLLGGGALSAAGTLALGALPIGLVALLLSGKGSGMIPGSEAPSAGKTGSGLASLLGPVGATHDVIAKRPTGGSRFSFRAPTFNTVGNESSSTSQSLKQLQSGLQGIVSPSQLSTSNLQKMYEQASRILSMPDITAKQRRGLQQLVGLLDPANLAMQKAGQVWGATFQGINVTTGSVMKQVQQTLSQDISAISANLGTGTKEGAQALVATFYSAWNSVLSNTSAAVRGTAKGIEQITKMLGSTLKAMGVKAPAGLTHSLAAGLATGDQQATLSTGAILSQGSLLGTGSGNIAGGLAAGGWHPSTPGGKVVVAEGGHDEVTLTTDPKYASRQQMLLGQYIQRVAPHMESGGFVPDPGTNFSVGVEPRIVSSLRSLADRLMVTIFGISGWRSPAHSVEVGGFSDDPHTRGGAADIAVNSQLRASAARITNQQLASVGLYRPFDPSDDPYNAEVNHVQLLGLNVGSLPIVNSAKGAIATSASTLAGLASSAKGAVATVQQLVAPTVQGVTGALGAIAQGAVNTTTQAANQYLAQFGATANGAVNTSQFNGSGSPSAARGWTAKAMRLAGVSGSLWTNLLLRQESRESTYRPNAVNNWDINAQHGDPSEGILQTTLSTFREYMLPGYGSILNPVDNITAAIRYMISRYGGGDPNTAAQVMWERGGGAYAGGGLIASHLRRTAIRHLRKKVMRFADGGRAPWGGVPVPIIAHEGERISNPSQWGEVARMAGTTPQGLDSHLGYDTGRPRQHFASGGIATAGTSIMTALQSLLGYISPPGLATLRPGQGSTATPSTGSLSSINSFLGGVSGNLFKSDPGSVFGSMKVLSQVFQSINSALGDISNLPIKSQVSKLTTLVENFADPNNPDSTLNLLAAAFQRFQVNISGWVTSLGYKVGSPAPASIAQIHGGLLQGSGFGGVSLAGPQLNAENVGRTGQTSLDALGVRASVEQTQYLQRQTEATKKAISGVRSRMSTIRHSSLSSKTKKDSLTKLQGLYTELVQQQENLNNSINGQISTTFEDEQQYIQDTLSQINDVYQTQQQQIQTKQSTAQAKGQYGALPSIDQALINSSQAQIAALQKPLEEAKKSHNSDLVAQIQQQISQLQETIGETAAQMIQDAMSAIQQTAQTQQAQVSMYQSIAQTQFSAASTQGQFQQAGATSALGLQLNQSSIQSQLQSYNGLLGQAIDTGNTGAVATITQTIDQLTAQLAQNYQAIQDNTAQMVNQEAQFTQSRGQFQTGTLSGLGQIISTIGQTTGFTDVGTLKQLAQGQNNVLSGTNSTLLGQLSQLGGGASGLSSLLGQAGSPQAFVSALSGANLSGIESGQSATWINTFETLINNLTQNTEAIATNNQQLAQLNGMLLQPQQWSTTMWTSFRNAIFSGMGNLLPQFQGTLGAGAAPTIAPVFTAGTVGPTSPTVGTVNIHHVPAATVEPRVLGQQFAFEVSNAV